MCVGVAAAISKQGVVLWFALHSVMTAVPMPMTVTVRDDEEIRTVSAIETTCTVQVGMLIDCH